MRPPAVSLRLRHKLAVAFVMVLLPVLGVVIYDNFSDYERLKTSILDGQMRTAEALGGALEATFDRALEGLEAVSDEPTVRSLDPARIGPYLAAYVAAHPEYRDLQAWDSRGWSLGSAVAAPPTQPPPSPSYADVFQQVLTTARGAISDVHPATPDGTTALIAAVPIRAPGSGTVAGVAMGTLDPNVLSGTTQSVQLAPGQDVFFADSAGRTVHQRSALALPSPESRSAADESIRTALSRGQFKGSVEGPSSGSLLETVTRTSRYGWLVGISTRESSALGGHSEQVAEEMLIYLATLLLGALLGTAAARSIISPLDSLVQTIKGLGRGDLYLRADVRTGDELQGASDALNEMAATLQREQRRLRFLTDTNAALTSSIEPGRVMQLLAEQATEVLGEACWVYVISSPEPFDCRLAGMHVTKESRAERLSRLMTRYHDWLVNNLVLSAVKSARTLLIRDVGTSELEQCLRRQVVGLGGTSLLVAPLVARGHAVGILASLSLSVERALGDEELALATDLAARAALVADNAMLIQQAQAERSRIEEYAREADQRRSELDAVIEAVGEGITIVDESGRVRRINRKGKEIWELPADWEEHRTVLDQVSHNDLRYPDGRAMPAEERPLVRAARGEVFSGLEGVLVLGGRRKHILFSSGSVKDSDGNLRLAMSVYRDITPIRELERAREEFVSVVAHDLRSPLTAINGFAGILRKLPPDSHGQEQETRAVDTILTSSKRLERMVEDLLDSSRIEARRLTLELQSVDLPRLLQEVCERSAEVLKGHPLRIEARGEIPPLRVDPARLEQILTNLLSNAAKYSFPDSEIVVEVERRGKEVLATVANRGQGIPPEESATIFSRFRRTRQARAGAVPGLGLGLYITKGLVEAHGGRIWVESEPGKTTAFRFTMPIDTAEDIGLTAA